VGDLSTAPPQTWTTYGVVLLERKMEYHPGREHRVSCECNSPFIIDHYYLPIGRESKVLSFSTFFFALLRTSPFANQIGPFPSPAILRLAGFLSLVNEVGVRVLYRSYRQVVHYIIKIIHVDRLCYGPKSSLSRLQRSKRVRRN